MSKKVAIILITFLAFSLFFSGSISLRAQTNTTVKIIWRDSTGQYYSFSRYSTLANDIRNAGGLVTSYNASVEVPENLSSYDIIVIPNPGEAFSDDEKEAIKEFVLNGGGLILMSDVQYSTGKYGKPTWLNELLDYIGISDQVSFWGTNENGDEIKDDSSNAGRPWQVIVTSDNFKPHLISVGISKVCIDSQSLVVTDPNLIVATGDSDSYAEDSEGTVHARGNIPWLAALEVEDGKVVLSGGSKTFSDAQIYGTGVPYITYGDNEKLFFNIISWISGQNLQLPSRIKIFIPILDIFGLMAGVLFAYFYGFDMGKILIFSVISGVIFALIAMAQVSLFGITVVGVIWPGWGLVAGGLETEYADIPAWAVAGIRYFLTGILEIIFGVGLFWIVLRLDDYLKLGIREKIKYSAGIRE
ncbi:MAG: hypothetical protein Q6351_005070 [Candidatus Njordarchaeum guaymaensis]